jgi:hypothetical protein
MEQEMITLSKVSKAQSPNITYSFFIHFFIYAYIVWAISPLYPTPPPPSPATPLHFQAESVLPLSVILLKRECKQ